MSLHLEQVPSGSGPVAIWAAPPPHSTVAPLDSAQVLTHQALCTLAPSSVLGKECPPQLIVSLAPSFSSNSGLNTISLDSAFLITRFSFYVSWPMSCCLPLPDCKFCENRDTCDIVPEPARVSDTNEMTDKYFLKEWRSVFSSPW